MKSDNAKKGVARAPHRSLFYAMGFTDEELDRPLVGVCCAKNEIIPGHIELDRIAEAVKAGVRMAGGTPIEFPAIGVCDGIAMGHEGMKYSLVTRELIADSIECMTKAHQFDALVMIPNCDKIVPGMLMAAARLDLPTVFVSGGPMMPGHLPGNDASNPYGPSEVYKYLPNTTQWSNNQIIAPGTRQVTDRNNNPASTPFPYTNNVFVAVSIAY